MLAVYVISMIRSDLMSSAWFACPSQDDSHMFGWKEPITDEIKSNLFSPKINPSRPDTITLVKDRGFGCGAESIREQHGSD